MSFQLKQVITWCLITVFLTSCSHQKYVEPKGYSSYEDSVEKIDLTSSFAFLHQGHSYYFVESRVKGYLGECARFDGYKDGQLTYSFPYKYFEKLSAIYSSDQSIDGKIDRAVKFIDSIYPSMYACEELPAKPKQSTWKKVNNALGDGLSFVVYGSMAVVVMPIFLPIYLADTMAEKRIDRGLRQIRLGATEEQVAKILGDDFKTDQSGEYKIQIFEVKTTEYYVKRFIFVYKDRKLHSYVWGLRPVQNSQPQKP